MEWVETTGRTVAEAKKSALEQLGVAENDADFQVVSEPKFGLFGRLKEEARVRARVQPRYPRSKGERRERRRNRGPANSENNSQNTSAPAVPGADVAADVAAHSAEGLARNGDGASSEMPRGGRRRQAPSTTPGATPGSEGGNFGDVKSASIEEQVQLAEEFLQGLLTEMGSVATITAHDLADGVVELSVDGENLGTLEGPREQRCSLCRN